MAGHRRAAGKPPKRLASAARRRERLDTELANAKTDADRVHIAADYVRAAMASQPVPDGVIDDIVECLVAAGDRINQIRGERRTP